MSQHQEETEITRRRDAILGRIEERLRIRVLYHDDDIVVIDKPCNLRSVAGHAHPPQPSLSAEAMDRGRKRSFSASIKGSGKSEIEDTIDPTKNQNVPSGSTRSDKLASDGSRMTAQQAWQEAIRSLSSLSTGDLLTETTSSIASPASGDSSNYDAERKSLVVSCLKKLSESESAVVSIPRKWKLFHKYVLRNQKRLLPSRPNCADAAITIEDVASQMYAELRRRQAPLMNVPQRTSDEDSAHGQLMLMGYAAGGSAAGEAEGSNELHVVHRLDCETSGVMVFARNQSAASSLCRAWREREQVSKEYWAKVRHWPPYHEEGLSEGRIEVPLAPSEERVKWKVADTSNGKPSCTIWKIKKEEEARDMCPSSRVLRENVRIKSGPVILSLMPITGRTHQLRLHCAHVGSGIVGDSLYGDDRLKMLGQDGKRLMLHAHQLSFRHPTTGKRCEFSSLPEW